MQGKGRLAPDSECFRAEFDSLADDYYEQHSENIAITGEGPEYFSEYKIEDLSRFAASRKIVTDRVFDFGCGIGNSIPYFEKHLRSSSLYLGDVSERSLDISRERFPSNHEYVLIGDSIPLESGSMDVVFSACVFHHIPHEHHGHWFAELLRIVKPGGVLAIYEHNPLNPLTVRAVNTCPLDVNAELIRGGVLKKRTIAAGWTDVRIDYKLFFPSLLKKLRPCEPFLERFCLGAQYRLTAFKPR